jgi:hypothetical protein
MPCVWQSAETEPNDEERRDRDLRDELREDDDRVDDPANDRNKRNCQRKRDGNRNRQHEAGKNDCDGRRCGSASAA